MSTPIQSSKPVVGKRFTDHMGRTFSVITIYWDQIIISYLNGGVRVVNHHQWQKLVPA